MERFGRRRIAFWVRMAGVRTVGQMNGQNFNSGYSIYGPKFRLVFWIFDFLTFGLILHQPFVINRPWADPVDDIDGGWYKNDSQIFNRRLSVAGLLIGNSINQLSKMGRKNVTQKMTKLQFLWPPCKIHF